MNRRPGACAVRELGIAHAVIAKEETVVEDDVNAAAQELRGRTPYELSTREHSPRVLFVAD
jgi:hypothetical protein